jgi:response regulator RpfG family c-di-GMP phosphodiesterase
LQGAIRSMSSRLNFLCVSSDAPTLARCEALSSEFDYNYLAVPNADKVFELEYKYDLIQFILISVPDFKNKEDLAALVQKVRKISNEGFICVVIGKENPLATAEFVKLSGANLVLLENEFFESSRIEFFASQIIRASYVPVKLSEFPKNAKLDFTLYHLMPLNQKLLPVLPKATPLSEGRLKKLEGISELFVRRDEVDRYRQYVESNPDLSNQGLKSRCRAQYLSFRHSHTQLIFLLSDQSEKASYKEGKWLYERCQNLAKDLLATLSSVGEAWDVVNNASLGEFGSVERSPTIAAYAGLLSLMGSVGEPVDVMMGSLLSDLGMLELSPSITGKIRRSTSLGELSADELSQYQKHPVLSVNRCVSGKLPIKDSIRNMILCSHERIDGVGFPEQKKVDQIPPGAMLIQFSELIDRKAIIKIGQPRMTVREAREQIFEIEVKENHIFSIWFLEKLKPVI